MFHLSLLSDWVRHDPLPWDWHSYLVLDRWYPDLVGWSDRQNTDNEGITFYQAIRDWNQVMMNSTRYFQTKKLRKLWIKSLVHILTNYRVEQTPFYTVLLSYAWLAHSSWRNNILEIFMLMVLVMRQSPQCPAHQPRSQISFLLVSRGEDD